MAKLRIGIDARELFGQPAGKGKYLERILAQWCVPGADFQGIEQLFLYVGKGMGEAIERRLRELGGEDKGELPEKWMVREVRGRGPLWHYLVGRQATNDGCQVFYAACSYQSALFTQVPTVTVVHDLAVFRLGQLAHNKRAQLVERATLRATVRRSSRLIAVSQATRGDLYELVSASQDKVEVVPGAPLLSAKVGSMMSQTERKSVILFVGTLEPRKNVLGLIRAFAGLSEDLRKHYQLVLIGKQGWGGEDYRGLVKELDVTDQVVFAGYQPDSAVLEAYRSATIFAYPSFYEGFGLPVIEALAAGTPVVTSSTSSLPEVVGKAGLVCDPSDTRAITAAFAQLLLSTDLWKQCSAEGLKQAARFSWESSARESLRIVSEVAFANVRKRAN